MKDTSESIFTKIINREIPATIEYEDDDFIAIKDINPKAPVHILIIPKHPYRTLEEVAISDQQFHAKLLLVARTVAQKVGIAKNYKLFMNVGEGVQEVHHVHLHLTGGWANPADSFVANA
jgi:histidine triad (HIT) family protein